MKRNCVFAKTVNTTSCRFMKRLQKVVRFVAAVSLIEKKKNPPSSRHILENAVGKRLGDKVV